MCQILGINSNKPYAANELLRKFYANSVDHPHGWGLAVLDEDQYLINKRAVQAVKSGVLKEQLETELICTHLFGHIRKASVGVVEYRNCHPFTRVDKNGRRWTLIHNGTFFHMEELEPYFDECAGTTDSEALLCYIVDHINQAGADLDFEERFRVIDDAMIKLSDDNGLNMMLFDGEVMYAHCNYEDLLYEIDLDGTHVLSTVPLTDEGWTVVPLNAVRAYKQGQLVRVGTDHGHEFKGNGRELQFI